MNWYDFIAPVYDRIITKMYAPYREMTIQSLGLNSGSAVLDFCCGSVLNFELIRDAIGSDGALIGVDFFTGMLELAQKAIRQNFWQNICLLQRDIRLPTRDDLTPHIGPDVHIDAIFCTLGFSVFPD